MNRLTDILNAFNVPLEYFNVDTGENVDRRADLEQSIFAWVDEVIGEDEEQVLPHPKLDNYDAVQRCVGRNQVRAEQRKRARS